MNKTREDLMQEIDEMKGDTDRSKQTKAHVREEIVYK